MDRIYICISSFLFVFETSSLYIALTVWTVELTMKTRMALKMNRGCGCWVVGKASRFGHVIVPGKEIKLEGEEERGVWVCSPDLGKLGQVRRGPYGSLLVATRACF